MKVKGVINLYRKILYLLVSGMLLTTPIYAKQESEFITLIDEENASKSTLKPTDTHNVIVKIDKFNKEETYSYIDRQMQEMESFILKEGTLKEYLLEDNLFDMKAVLYNKNSNIIFEPTDEQYFSYVTLPSPATHTWQGHTGEFSDSNCAPTTLSIIYNWANDLHPNQSSVNAEWIRDKYPSNTAVEGSQGYSAYQIERIMKDLGLQVESSYFNKIDNLITELNNGKILALNLVAGDIPKGSLDSFINKTYEGGKGHSVVCTGYLYRIKDGQEKLYLEIVDPAVYNSEKRYWDASYVANSMWNGNWQYIAIAHN